MGGRWPTFVCEYEHDGKTWGLDIVARDEDDARARIASLRGLRLLGKLGGRIPAAVPGAGILTRLICTIGNVFCTGR